MKKIITMALVALFAVGGVQAQHCGHHGNGGHCGRHQQAQQVAAPRVNADGIAIEIANAFPTVKSVKKAEKWTEVYDGSKKLLGYALYSKPASDGIKGYAGETPVMIALSPKKVILSVELLPNAETPGYVNRVTAAGFLNSWNGLTVKKAKKKQVDTVSGATFTSRAVIQSVQAALNTL